MVPPSGFFSNPGGSGVKLAAVELARYRWAASFCKGKAVLDYGCGYGQGAHILAEKASLVVGFDIDEDAIAGAYDYIETNLGFTSNKSKLFNGKVFEVVVCLEVIEHIEDGQKLLDEIKSLLNRPGQLLLSTPNKFYTEKHGLKNPYHLHEYYPKEIQKLLLGAGFSIEPYSEGYDASMLDRLAPITPLFIKKIWRKYHKVRVLPLVSNSNAVQLYRCWLMK